MRLPMALVLIGAVACGSTASTKTAPPPDPLEHSLSGLAAQRVVVLPAYGARVMPGLDWAAAIGPPATAQKTLDADIVSALAERGVGKTWLFPEQLFQSYQRNSTYATDPYALAEESLRAPGLAVDARLSEPLASQLRTLVALHENARLVLAPVDLRFEKAGAGGRGRLRLVLIDPRYSSITWIGEISSDTLPAFSPAISAGIASRLANMLATP